jgi:ankyrin repeat protein
MWAAAKGRTDNIAVLLKAGAKVNTAAKKGFTPLFFALQSKVPAASMALLDAGADAKAVLPDGTTVIQAALLMKNDPFAMQVVSRGADVNQRDSKGWQLIHTAALSGNPELIKMVLAKGGNANAVTTPPPIQQQKGVLYAAMLIQNGPAWDKPVQVAALGSASPKPVKTDAAGVKRRPLEAFEYLLPPPGTPTPALLLAAQSGSVEAMKVLIAAGADPKAKGADGLTLALAAARGGNLEALKYALELDPDIHALAQEGRSIMHMVVENRNSDQYEEVITYLADKGAALNVVDERRISPGSFVNRVGPEKLRVFYIQLLKDRKVDTKRAPD